MNLWRILQFDLGRLVGKPRESEPAPRLAPRRGLFRRRMPELPFGRLDGYRPAFEYPPRKLRWRGPAYVRDQTWRRDLVAVLEQIRAIVRTNGSLPEGLFACAREESRYGHGFRLSKLSIYLLVGLIGVAALAAVANPDLAVGSTGHIVVYVLLIRRFSESARRHIRRERVFLVLGHRLRQGASLSEAMAGMSRFFPAFQVSMVRAGEDTGSLEGVLEDLSTETLRRTSITQGIYQSLAYVATVAVVQGSIMLFLVFKVIPVFEDIATEFGDDLTRPTRALLDVADFCVTNNDTIVGIVILGILFVVIGRHLTRRKRRSLLGRWSAGAFLLVPGLRGLLVRHNLSVVALMLDKLLRAGVPMPRALDAASRSDLHPFYAAWVKRMRDRVEQGDSLTDACKGFHAGAALPRSFRGFIGLGESSGMLPDALRRVGEFYRRDVELRVRVLADGVLPLCILALGGLTLFYELALMGCLVGLVTTLLEQI